MIKTILFWILDYLWAKLWPLAQKAIDRMKRKTPQEKAIQQLEDDNKNGASVEQKEKDEKDFLNS